MLLAGAAVAEEVSKPESSLKANFRRVGLELSSTNVAVFAAFGKHGIKEDIAAFENILRIQPHVCLNAL